MPLQPRHALIALLLAAFLAADAAMLLLSKDRAFPVPSAVLHFALAFAQFNLLAIWGGLGSLHFALRLPTMAALAVLVAIDAPYSNTGQWAIVVAAQLAVVVAPLLLARYFVGLRLESEWTELASGTPSRRRPVQFSLRNLLIAVTIIGVALGVARLMAPFFRGFDLHVLLEVSAVGGGFAIVGLVAAWFGLGTGRWVMRTIVLALVTCSVGWLVASLANPPPRVRLSLFLLVVVQTLLLAGSLAVLRIAGYRLTRRARPVEFEVVEPADESPFG